MAEAQITTETPGSGPFRTWGFWAVATGAIAVVFVLFQVFGPTPEPPGSAAQQIGEIAGEMKRAAWRSFLGLKPEAVEPLPEPSLVSQYLPVTGPVLGVVAILLSVISAVLKENWRLPAYGTALGASAILFQMFWWVALLIAGVVLLVSIVANLGEFFSF